MQPDADAEVDVLRSHQVRMDTQHVQCHAAGSLGVVLNSGWHAADSHIGIANCFDLFDAMEFTEIVEF